MFTDRQTNTDTQTETHTDKHIHRQTDTQHAKRKWRGIKVGKENAIGKMIERQERAQICDDEKRDS